MIEIQSNRLTVTLDEDMGIDFIQDIQTVYLNSHMVNEFVVRPTFLLAPQQTLWATFANAETYEQATVKLEPAMLAERQTTVANSTEQVVRNDTVSSVEQTDESGVEYYMELPDEILANAGTWYFSLAVRVVPDTATPTAFKQIYTSGVESFTVNNSLAGVPGGAPTDFDIAAIWRQTTQNAKIVNDAVENAITDITEEVTQSTQAAITVETERATAAETQLGQQITAETERATDAEETLGTRITETNTKLIQITNEIAQDLSGDIDQVNDRVDDINALIPTAANKNNQLADKAFVNSSINAMAAFFITPTASGDKAFATKAALTSATVFYSGGQPRTPTQNDYAIVLSDESQTQNADGTYPTTRYSWQGGTYPTGQWDFQYIVNNSPFTQAQVDALNSGITEQKIADMDAATAAKYTKPSTGIPETDLANNVQTKLNSVPTFELDGTTLKITLNS